MRPDSSSPAVDELALGRWCIAWQRLAEGFLGGIQHALNNRSAALSAIAQVMNAGVPAGQGLEEALGYEVERLHTVVGYLGLLRHSGSGSPEPLDVRSIVAALTDICPEHSGMKDVRCEVGEDPGILPIVADPSLLSRLLLAAMAAAGLATPEGEQGSIRVGYDGDEEWVTITVEAGRDGGATGEAADPLLDTASLQWPVSALGGELLETDAEITRGRTVLRFPTLLQTRRRERSG